MEWPGWDGPPVVINAARNGRSGRRLGPDAAGGRGARYYVGPNGELLVPAGGMPGRSASVSAPRPANIVINNDQFNEEFDVVSQRRPRSHSRGAYEEDYETRRKLERLRELERKEEEEERERVKEHKELKKAAIEEWKVEQAKKKEKEDREKAEADREFEERTRRMLWRNGYSEAQIERMIKKDKQKEKGGGGGGGGESAGGGGGGGGGNNNDTRIIALNRPTYIRVRVKHLDPETLDLYGLPWEWDDEDDSYIIIKKWVNERDQEILFEHTRKLRETKQLTYTTTELRKERDQLLLVKKKSNTKKSPARKSWLLT